uniref:Uncharacterized protein n=1 Tax=Anguilla anguilla TaxID=7936 RepID=A0A0E9WED6_ANGAN
MPCIVYCCCFETVESIINRTQMSQRAAVSIPEICTTLHPCVCLWKLQSLF